MVTPPDHRLEPPRDAGVGAGPLDPLRGAASHRARGRPLGAPGALPGAGARDRGDRVAGADRLWSSRRTGERVPVSLAERPAARGRRCRASSPDRIEPFSWRGPARARPRARISCSRRPSGPPRRSRPSPSRPSCGARATRRARRARPRRRPRRLRRPRARRRRRSRPRRRASTTTRSRRRTPPPSRSALYVLRHTGAPAHVSTTEELRGMAAALPAGAPLARAAAAARPRSTPRASAPGPSRPPPAAKRSAPSCSPRDALVGDAAPGRGAMSALLAELLEPGRFALERPWLVPAIAARPRARSGSPSRGAGRCPPTRGPPSRRRAPRAPSARDPLRRPAAGAPRRRARAPRRRARRAAPPRRAVRRRRARASISCSPSTPPAACAPSTPRSPASGGAASTWRARWSRALPRERASAGDRVGVVVFGDTAFTLCPLDERRRARRRCPRARRGGHGRRVDGPRRRPRPRGEARRRRLGARATRRAPPAPRRPSRAASSCSSPTGARTPARCPSTSPAALARATGTRVHTVGIGSRGEVAMASRTGGRTLRFERHDLDTETLRASPPTRAGAASRRVPPPTSRRSTPRSTRWSASPRETPRASGETRPEPLLAGAGAAPAGRAAARAPRAAACSR